MLREEGGASLFRLVELVHVERVLGELVGDNFRFLRQTLGDAPHDDGQRTRFVVHETMFEQSLNESRKK